MDKPTPIDEQVPLDKYKYILSRTNNKGTIEFANDYFYEISGYTADEMIGRPHSMIRHPDMPKVIFKLMWDRLRQGKNIFAVVKNLAKDGRYYWVTTKFEIRKNPLDKTISGYMAYRQATKPRTINQMSKLYQDLKAVEESSGVEASEKYFIGYLESKRMTYDEFIDDAIGNNGAFKLFFKAMEKVFGRG